MSENIKATIKGYRGNPPVLTTIATNVDVQMDKMIAAEAVGYESAEPHFTYEAFTTSLPISDPQLVRQGDVVIDQNTVDSNTGTNRQYRIVSDPESFPDWHFEWINYRYRGQ